MGSRGLGRKREFRAENSAGPDSQAIENTKHQGCECGEIQHLQEHPSGIPEHMLNWSPNSLWK